MSFPFADSLDANLHYYSDPSIPVVTTTKARKEGEIGFNIENDLTNMRARGSYLALDEEGSFAASIQKEAQELSGMNNRELGMDLLDRGKDHSVLAPIVKIIKRLNNLFQADTKQLKNDAEKKLYTDVVGQSIRILSKVFAGLDPALNSKAVASGS